jgi:DNA polymerase-3 subunit delta'
MAFANLISEIPTLGILQKSIERERVGHAYLFTGANRETLERAAIAFAKAVNCQQTTEPNQPSLNRSAEFCDHCTTCERINTDHHGDVQRIRPESKMRIITMTQMRQLMDTLHLKPNDAQTKVWMISDADRMNQQSANAFLKTLEEPPENSLMILLSTQPDRLLNTILSRCLRLNFPGDSTSTMQNEHQVWLEKFAQQLAAKDSGMLDRYKALDILFEKLTDARLNIEDTLKDRFLGDLPNDVEPKMREKREQELKAAIEAEYRRRRTEVFTALEWWLRDAWLLSLQAERSTLTFPDLAHATQELANRVDARKLLDNIRLIEKLQRVLHTNVQEALALEVHLLKLNL